MVGLLLKIVRGQRGQALVETALAVPLLLLLVLGMVDFGKAVNYKNDLTHLANEAVRYATVNYCVPGSGGSCVLIEDAVRNDAESQYLRNNMTLSICFNNPPPGWGDDDPYPPAGEENGRLTVKVSAPYQFIPWVFGRLGVAKTLTGSASMYQEAHYPGFGTGGNYHAKAC